MPAITKAQAKAILTYVLSTIIEDDEDDGSAGPIQTCPQESKGKRHPLKGILDLNSMSANTLENLTYRDVSSNTDTTLKKGESGLLKTFRAYIYYRDSISDPLDSHKKWMSITLEDFQRFRISKEWFTISKIQANR
jgi:hypothetical protein